jgi:hypothetical protein
MSNENKLGKEQKTVEQCFNELLDGYMNIPIGSVFKMQGKLWEVKTYGENGWLGVECQDQNRAFTSERIEDVQKYLSEL